ncbi:hypothetical protein EDD37DRAFT_632140 [Exophiala viscosa]|uniref:uncharacterized protein n=1 Tax=Exophiala viscosa TaxID=2486360 RepID=UPI00218EDA81|nr:hypothetical protein EDD37DRAFT_632140 [Exophiala viscosa]
MTSHIVYDNVSRTQANQDNDSDETPKLFSGQTLWFSHAVPQRQWLMENARLNGATIVNRDVDANIKLVDHARKNQAPGTHSYKYVESSIRNGVLENLADHAVGVSTRVARPVGSTVTAPRGGRVAYTEEDDQFLWNWMKPFEDNGGVYKGNEIYKQIEEVNPRHTFQSWRDRWIKSTRFQKRQLTNTAQSEERRPHLADDDAERSTQSPTPEPAQAPLRSSPSGKRKRGPDDGGERVRPKIQPTRATRSLEARNHQNVDDPVPPVTAAEQDTAGEARQAVPLANAQAAQAELGAEQVEVQGEEDDTELLGLSPSNVGGGFNIKEYKALYRMVPELTDAVSDEFQGLWKELAASPEYPGHKPDQWKYFFEYRVVPDYCRNKKLKLEEVAPYMCARQESNLAGEQHSGRDKDGHDNDDEKEENQQDQDELSEARTTPGLMMCTNCYTNNSERWRHDREGKPLCNECAVFLRTHGVPRSSTMGLGAFAEQAETSGKRPQTPSRQISPKNFTITPIVGSVQLSPILLPAEPSVAEAVYARTPPPKSPSFQPESPTLSRPPEPNSSRKRGAGRGSQSQSQSQSLSQPVSIRELNPPSTQSHTQTGSEAHPSEMGEAQSKEVQPEEQLDAKSQNPITAVPSFRATTGTRPRKTLQDDPDNLDVQQDSSLSTDIGPPREPPVIPSTESEDEFTFPPYPLLGNMSMGDPRFLPQSSSSESEDHDDEGIEEEEDSVVIKQEKAATPDHESSPDFGSRANIVRQQAAEEPQPTRKRQRENSVATGGQGVLQESRRNASPEIPMERLASGSQPMDNWETAPEEQQQGTHKERRLSTQALFDRPNTHYALDLGLEIPDPEGGWDSILGPGAANDPEYEDSGAVALDVNTARNKQPAIPARESREDGGSLPEDTNRVRPSSTARSTDLVELQVAQQTAEDDSITDQWLAHEESLYPNEPNLRPICIKALECTSINFERATDVVEIMLDELKRKRRRTSRSGFIAVNEVEIPDDMPGVWTDEDDRLLLSRDKKDVLRMIAKHGRPNCDARFDFWIEYVEN